MSIIYLFIDGIGIGENNALINPFSRYATSLLEICKGNFYFHNKIKNDLKVIPLDASMGVEGIPQSATGQTSLWTGVNAPKVLGHHITGFPGPRLKKIIYDHSIIKKFKEHNLASTLLNAYTPKYLEKLEKLPRFASASTHVQKSSGQSLFVIDDILKKKAIYMDITHHILHQYYPEYREKIPIMDPFSRGIDLVEISHNYELVIFEYFLSDKAGHNQSFEAAKFVIGTLEKFIHGIIEAMNYDDTLIITSDHGNMEDLSTNTHTKNLVPLILYGKLKKEFRNLTYLSDIPLWIYKIYNIEHNIDESIYMNNTKESLENEEILSDLLLL